MSESGKAEESVHHHRGKSSESRLDKEVILAALKIAPGEGILDAGCGNGYMAREFARLVGGAGKVYALDPDSAAIETLQSKTKDTNIEAFVGDITEETPLPASSLDLIYISTVIHGFSKTQIAGFLLEIKRLLKPGGRLAVVEIEQEAPFGPPLDIRLSPEDLRQLIDLPPGELVEVGQYFYLQFFSERKPVGESNDE